MGRYNTHLTLHSFEWEQLKIVVGQRNLFHATGAKAIAPQHSKNDLTPYGVGSFFLSFGRTKPRINKGKMEHFAKINTMEGAPDC